MNIDLNQTTSRSVNHEKSLNIIHYFGNDFNFPFDYQILHQINRTATTQEKFKINRKSSSTSSKKAH